MRFPRTAPLAVVTFFLAACQGEMTSPRSISPRGLSRTIHPAGTALVTPLNTHGWSFVDDQNDVPCTDATVCRFVLGPGTAPLGNGSAELATPLSSDGKALALADYAGTRLDAFTTLSYSTYRQTADAGNNLAIALQFNVDYDLNDAATGFMGRIVFEPYQTNGGGVLQNTWQTWDAKSGKWWGSKATVTSGNASVANPCVQATPCTLSQLITAFPNIGVHATLGAVVLKAGSSWPGFRGNVDNLTIGVSGVNTTYNFDPGCTFTMVGSAWLLDADCVVDESLALSDGRYGGNGHSITAKDPAGGHFLGPVVTNAAGATSIDIDGFYVTASGLANICDPSSPVDTRLRGILLQGVSSSSVTNSTVTGVRQGLSGCQEGNAIEIRNLDASGNPAPDQVAVTLSGNTVSNYQKNGITTNGNVAANIIGNVVTGDGAIDYTAQNGIQVAYGATALLKNNTVSGNNYTPSSYVACGILFYQAGGVKSQNNNTFGNERNVCNFGKGGGKFNPLQ